MRIPKISRNCLKENLLISVNWLHKTMKCLRRLTNITKGYAIEKLFDIM